MMLRKVDFDFYQSKNKFKHIILYYLRYFNH